MQHPFNASLGSNRSTCRGQTSRVEHCRVLTGFRCQKRFGTSPACSPTIPLSFSQEDIKSQRLCHQAFSSSTEIGPFVHCPGQAARLPPGLYKYRFFFDHLKSQALQTSFPLESRDKSCSWDRLCGSSPCGSGTCSGPGATGLFDSPV